MRFLILGRLVGKEKKNPQKNEQEVWNYKAVVLLAKHLRSLETT